MSMIVKLFVTLAKEQKVTSYHILYPQVCPQNLCNLCFQTFGDRLPPLLVAIPIT